MNSIDYTQRLPPINIHADPRNPKPQTQTLPGITVVSPPSPRRPPPPRNTQPPRTPLAVTSINAILNNPISSSTPGKGFIKPLNANPRQLTSLSPSNPITHTAISYPLSSIPNKRKTPSDEEHQEIDSGRSGADPPIEISDRDERLYNIDQNCDQIRRKINNLLNSGDMKVGEFVRAIGVNSKSYGSFMKLSGPYKGSSNGTFHNAFAFFKKRELMGIKSTKRAKVSKEQENKVMDVSGVHLEGQEDMEVPVYDTCDEIRRKITAFLREPGVTQAGFLREIAKSFPDGRNSPQSKVLKDFLGKRGAKAGNTSAVFYGSYVFFEKMRIRDGKPKTQFREEMERIYGAGDSGAEDGPSKRSKRGIDIKKAYSGRVTCMKGERVVEDKYGRLSFL